MPPNMASTQHTAHKMHDDSRQAGSTHARWCAQLQPTMYHGLITAMCTKLCKLPLSVHVKTLILGPAWCAAQQQQHTGSSSSSSSSSSTVSTQQQQCIWTPSSAVGDACAWPQQVLISGAPAYMLPAVIQPVDSSARSYLWLLHLASQCCHP
jgi:hypothetical protein